MLFRDNLTIRLVLVYWSKENLGSKYSKSFLFHFFIRHSTFLHLSPAVERIQEHFLGVFKKTRVSGYILLREKQKYQVTNVFVKRNCHVCYLILFNLERAKISVKHYSNTRVKFESCLDKQ